MLIESSKQIAGVFAPKSLTYLEFNTRYFLEIVECFHPTREIELSDSRGSQVSDPMANSVGAVCFKILKQVLRFRLAQRNVNYKNYPIIII